MRPFTIAVLCLLHLPTVFGASSSKKLLRREDYIDNSGSNVQNITINVPLNNAGANNQSWINPAKFDTNIKIPYTSLVATAFSTGGGNGQTINGGAYGGRKSGGGTRNEIYGTARYGSGHGKYVPSSSGDGMAQYEPVLALDVSGRDFPHGFPPISFGDYGGGDEYYGRDENNFPGRDNVPSNGELNPTPYHTDGLVLRKDKYIWILLADAVTLKIVTAVLALPEAQGGCNYPYLLPEALERDEASRWNANRTIADQHVVGYGTTLAFADGIKAYFIYPWNVMQFYRGSSVALGSAAYENEFAFNGNNNTNYLASSPLNTTDIDMNFFQCLNQTIAASIPIVNPNLILRSRLTGGQIAGIVVGSVAGAVLILAGLWFWYRKRRTNAPARKAHSHLPEENKGIGKGEAPGHELLERRTPSTVA